MPWILSGGSGASLALVMVATLGVGPVGAPDEVHDLRAGAQVPVLSTASLAGHRIRYAPGQAQLPLTDGAMLQVGSMLATDARMKHGDYRWNEDGAVSNGPLLIRIDLNHQILSVFRGGDEIGTAVILYGGTDKPTPAGTFHILQKARDYHSRSYDAPMPYMLRLTDDGVAIHGSDVQPGAATHGCIGVPIAFARRLFDVTVQDAQVVILPAAHSKI